MPCEHCGSGAHPTRLHGISVDIKDNRWSLLSADLRELEQQIASHAAAHNVLVKRIAYLETVCEQCILEHQGRSI